MNIHVQTLEIDPCGCGFEGSIRFQLADTGTEIRCGYTSMNEEAVTAAYRVGIVTEAPVFLAFGVMKRTSKRTPSLSPTVVGRFGGWVTIDGDTYGVVDGLARIPVDNELGESILDLEPGDWVECSGELMLGHKNEEGLTIRG